MNRIWQLQEAKNKFSEVVEEAIKNGPQVVTKRGVQTVIVISYEEYQKLIVRQQKTSEFFRTSPLAELEDELDILRDHRSGRQDIDL